MSESKIVIIKSPFSTLPGSATFVDDTTMPTECLLIQTHTHEILINFKTGKTKRTKRPTFEPIPNFGRLYVWQDFVRSVLAGDLMDDDGSGSLATATTRSDIGIAPSRICHNSKSPFDWATHVCWCNR